MEDEAQWNETYIGPLLLPLLRWPVSEGGSFFTYSWSFFAYSEASLLTVPQGPY